MKKWKATNEGRIDKATWKPQYVEAETKKDAMMKAVELEFELDKLESFTTIKVAEVE